MGLRALSFENLSTDAWCIALAIIGISALFAANLNEGMESVDDDFVHYAFDYLYR